MKVTPDVVRQFEEDQQEYSTEVAIHNLLHATAVEQLKDLGVQSVQTTYHHKDKVRA